jgi:hypothetical protein
MTLTYSPLISAPVTAALQAKERFVLAALRELPAEGEFRWTTWTEPGKPDCYVLRHASDGDRCLAWVAPDEIRRKLTEAFIRERIRGRARTVPGSDSAHGPSAG